jgi:hypothetical protein
LVKSFSIVGPYTLKIAFNDGLCRDIDFRPVLQGELFGPLHGWRLFDQVRRDEEVHTLVWPDGAHFDPATLHDWPAQAKRLPGSWSTGIVYDLTQMPDGRIVVVELGGKEIPEVSAQFNADGSFQCPPLMTCEPTRAAIRADRDAR